MHCVLSGIQDQILLLLYIFFHSRIAKEVKSDNSQFPIILAIVKNFSLKCVILENKLKSQQGTVQLFFGTESTLKGSPLTSKAASGYFGQSVWYWIKGNVPRVEKIRPDTNKKGFT